MAIKVNGIYIVFILLNINVIIITHNNKILIYSCSTLLLIHRLVNILCEFINK